MDANSKRSIIVIEETDDGMLDISLHIADGEQDEVVPFHALLASSIVMRHSSMSECEEVVTWALGESEGGCLVHEKHSSIQH